MSTSRVGPDLCLELFIEQVLGRKFLRSSE